MRESIGATWIFSICLTFIILFTAYLAISVNYAKAFRIKNYIVSNIEENEGFNGTLEQNIETYLISEGYAARGRCPSLSDWLLVGEPLKNTDGTSGACIYRMRVIEANSMIEGCGEKAYYKVIAFFKFDLPVVNYLTTFKVSGESNLIHDFSSC